MKSYKLKEKGNTFFRAENFEEALSCYSKAIILNDREPIYLTNRALCYLKLHQWELACQDFRRALDLDPTSVKGYLFYGQALLELENYDEAAKYLQRASELAKKQSSVLAKDIATLLSSAKKKHWAEKEEKRISQEIELRYYLNKLVLNDKEKEIKKLQESGMKKENDIATLTEKCDSYQREINGMFDKLDERRRRRLIPNYLCGKTTSDIITEPVISPSGITYEKKEIESHIERIGRFDPIAGISLHKEDLIPNSALKEAIDAFLAENEWAIDY